MRWRGLLLTAVILWGGGVPALRSHSGLPAIPARERFTQRNDLSATLRLEPSVLAPGQTPEMWLVLRNTSTRPVRVSPQVDANWNVRLAVHDNSGQPLFPGSGCIIDRWQTRTPVRDLMVLGPGESREFSLKSCGGLPRMPQGEYRVRATYYNAPDFPSHYDIYEDTAREVWEGRLDATHVLTVLPLDRETERRLIEMVDGPARAPGGAISLLGLGRSTAAADSLVRRFQQHGSMVAETILALVDIGDPAALTALAATLEEHVTRTWTSAAERAWLELLIARSSLDSSTMHRFVHNHGCAAIPLRLLQFVPPSSDTLLEQRCPDLRTRLRDIQDTPLTAAPGSDAHRIQTARASSARQLLTSLDRQESPPPPPPPAELKSPESLDPRKLGDWVRSLLDGSATDDVPMRGLASFGTKDTYLELRDKLEAADATARVSIGKLLEVITFHEPPGERLYRDPRYWDGWWRVNGTLSRAQWAEDALARWRPREGFVDVWSVADYAAEYLLTIRHNSPDLVSRLARHRSWFVRLAVADTVAAYDRKRAALLMLREFGGRYIAACSNASDRLATLMGREYPVDCVDPTERQQAAAYWARVLAEPRRSQ